MNGKALRNSMKIGFNPSHSSKSNYLGLSFHTSALRIMLLACGKKAGVLAA